MDKVDNFNFNFELLVGSDYYFYAFFSRDAKQQKLWISKIPRKKKPFRTMF